MQSTPKITVNPPLMNTPCPKATYAEELQALFDCPYTGAITTRTSMIEAYPFDDKIHQYRYFDPITQVPQVEPEALTRGGTVNSIVFSPFSLDQYLSFVQQISDKLDAPSSKVVFVSVAGTPEECKECYRRIAKASLNLKFPVTCEINLSCPNVPNKKLPAYDSESLREYLVAMKEVTREPGLPRIAYGLKIPPYTYMDQFTMFVDTLAQDGPSELSFVIGINTVGSCLMYTPDNTPSLPLEGFGGMAGAPIHPLALGNVRILKQLLSANPNTCDITLVGVGGVEDAAGNQRMLTAGADVVGVASAILFQGLDVFKRIAEGR